MRLYKGDDASIGWGHHNITNSGKKQWCLNLSQLHCVFSFIWSGTKTGGVLASCLMKLGSVGLWQSLRNCALPTQSSPYPSNLRNVTENWSLNFACSFVWRCLFYSFANVCGELLTTALCFFGFRPDMSDASQSLPPYRCVPDHSWSCGLCVACYAKCKWRWGALQAWMHICDMWLLPVSRMMHGKTKVCVILEMP